jgi:hypothetical protein
LRCTGSLDPPFTGSPGSCCARLPTANGAANCPMCGSIARSTCGHTGHWCRRADSSSRVACRAASCGRKRAKYRVYRVRRSGWWVGGVAVLWALGPVGGVLYLCGCAAVMGAWRGSGGAGRRTPDVALSLCLVLVSVRRRPARRVCVSLRAVAARRRAFLRFFALRARRGGFLWAVVGLLSYVRVPAHTQWHILLGAIMVENEKSEIHSAIAPTHRAYD